MYKDTFLRWFLTYRIFPCVHHSYTDEYVYFWHADTYTCAVVGTCSWKLKCIQLNFVCILYLDKKMKIEGQNLLLNIWLQNKYLFKQIPSYLIGFRVPLRSRRQQQAALSEIWSQSLALDWHQPLLRSCIPLHNCLTSVTSKFIRNLPYFLCVRLLAFFWCLFPKVLEVLFLNYW